MDFGIEREEIEVDESARQSTYTIRLPPDKIKTIKTPSLFARIKTSADIDYIEDFILECHPSNFGGIVIELNQAKKIRNKLDKFLKKTYVTDFKQTLDFKSNLLCIVDPQTELAYYKSSPSVEAMEGLPDFYIEGIMNIPSRKRGEKIREYKKLLEEIERKPHSYTLKFLKKEKIEGSDILIPPSPLIIPEIPSSLQVAFLVNDETQKICNAMEGWIPSAYFLLKVSDFEDEEIYPQILEYIMENNPRFLFLKIIDAYVLDNRNSAIQRHYFHKFLNYLAKITMRQKIFTFFFNLDVLGVFLTIMGIDAFDTPTNGYIQRIIVSPKNLNKPFYEKGSYFHSTMLSLVPFKFIYNLSKKGQPLPCVYGCCSKYKGVNLASLSYKEKVRMCRIHYLNTLNGLLEEIKDAITKKNTRAVINKLYNSACKHFYEIINGLNTPIEI